MRTSTVAKRFAKALMEVGIEEKAAAKYGHELSTAVGVFKGSPELYRILLNPMYRIEDRNGLMNKISGALQLSPAVARFLNILVATRHIRLLETVTEAYSKLEDDIAGRIRATVEAPFDLSSQVVDDIRGRLRASTGREVVLSSVKNPALIGGLVIRMDNTIIDGSLKTQLDIMKEKIMEGVA